MSARLNCLLIMFVMKFYTSSGEFHIIAKGKGKTIPVRPVTGPEGSIKLRLPDFKTVGI